MPTKNCSKVKKVKQESLNTHVADVNYEDEDDWKVRLINQTNNVNVKELIKRQPFWKCEQHTFQPNGLNEAEVALLIFKL